MCHSNVLEKSRDANQLVPAHACAEARCLPLYVRANLSLERECPWRPTWVRTMFSGPPCTISLAAARAACVERTGMRLTQQARPT